MRRPGLRLRLLGALLLVPVISIAVGAAVLLPSLEHRLRQSALTSLRATVEESRAAFRDARRPGGGVDRDRVARAAAGLAARAGARVTVQDGAGETVYASGPAGALGAERMEATARRSGTADGIEGDAAIVAMRLPVGDPPWTLSAGERLRQVDAATADVRRGLVIAATAGLLAALVLATILSFSLLHRLARLRDAVHRFEATGGDDTLPADRHRDELGELARSFSSMAERVRRQETARRRFVATASHELRTPVASLRATLELLEARLDDSGPLEREQVRAGSAQARAQAQRLGVLADELLELSRVDAGLAARSEPVELGDLAHAVLGEFRDRARQAGTPIDLDVPDAPHWVMGDPGSLARVLRILVDNALRFAPPRTSVRVTIRPGEIAVADDGPGVPPDEREAIFERFARGRTPGPGAGFGLGLAIGRELMRRMGGDLVLDADRPVGSRFVARVDVLSEPVESQRDEPTR